MVDAPTDRKLGRGQGRKPVDLVAATGYRTPQDFVWEAIRKLNIFTHKDICLDLWRRKIAGVNDGTVKSYMNRLLKGGYIEVKHQAHIGGAAYERTYELINDVGVHAPNLTKEGQPSNQGRSRENMWRAMKIIGAFNFHELAEAASTKDTEVKTTDAKDYVKKLKAAGYLRVVKDAVRGANPTPERLVLIPSKNTGPLPPMVQRTKRVFDPNLNRVMWTEVDA